MPEPESAWSLYLLRSTQEQRTYVGVTVDVARRLLQHNGELPGGAKATRRGRPWTLHRVWGAFASQSEVQQAEAALKRLTGEQRIRIPANFFG